MTPARPSSFTCQPRTRAAAALALAGLVVACTGAPAELPVEGAFTVVRDLPYVTDSGPGLRLDLYLPDTPVAVPVPVVVMVRGGGFRTTDKAGFAPLAGALADRGFAAASIEYRSAAQARFPGATEDTKAAVRWLRFHAATYGLDPEAIALMGGSAGAYLAIFHAVTDGVAEFEGNRGTPQVSSAVQAVVAMAPESGPSQLAAWTEYLGETDGPDPERRREASALNYIDPEIEPPLLLMHSPDDAVVAYRESERLFEAYAQTGNTARLEAVEDAPHAFWFEPRFFTGAMDRAAAFLRLALLEPPPMSGT